MSASNLPSVLQCYHKQDEAMLAFGLQQTFAKVGDHVGLDELWDHFFVPRGMNTDAVSR